MKAAPGLLFESATFRLLIPCPQPSIVTELEALDPTEQHEPLSARLARIRDRAELILNTARFISLPPQPAGASFMAPSERLTADRLTLREAEQIIFTVLSAVQGFDPALAPAALESTRPGLAIQGRQAHPDPDQFLAVLLLAAKQQEASAQANGK